MKFLSLLSFFLLGFSASAQADIYKHVDAEGHVTYTNLPQKGAKRLNLDPVPASSAKQKGASSPSSFPRVDGETQKRRDDMRHKILDDELAAEKKQLEEARKAQAEGEATRLGDERNNYQKYLDRVQKLKDDVSRHEQNIGALQKEIANLK